MLRSSIFQSASILGALLIWTAVEDRIKGSVGKLTARGDVWTIGYQIGYDRGYADGRRAVLLPVTRAARRSNDQRH